MTMTASFFESGFQPVEHRLPALNRLAEEPIQRLVSISSTPLLVADEAGTLIGASKPAELMLDYQPGELRGQLAAVVLPILDRMPYEALKGGFRTFVRCGNGRMLSQRIVTIPLSDKDFIGWVVLLRHDSPF